MEIHNYVKTSLIDYPGKLACVVFTQGCMWNCWFCQNAELLPLQKGQVSEQEVLNFLKTRVNQLDAVVVCGGEPTMQKDLPKFIKQIKDLGFLVKLDTNGTNPIVVKELLDKKLLDYVAMDIKTIPSKYDDVAKTKVNLNALKQTIDLLINSNIDYEFRTTAIPTILKQDFLEIAKSIRGAKHYYIQHYISPSKSHPKPTYIDTDLQEIVALCNDYVKTSLR